MKRLLLTPVLMLFFNNSVQAQVDAAQVRIKNAKTSQCYTLSSDKLSIVQGSCTKSDRNSFLITARSDGSYALKNKASGLCLQIKDSSVLEGAVMNQAACSGLPNQHFTPKFSSGTKYFLMSQLSGSCLSVTGSRVAPVMKRCTDSIYGAHYIVIDSGSLPHVITDIDETPIVPQAQVVLPTVYKGLNLGGGESGNLTDQNKYGWTYAYPKNSYIDYMVSKGMTVVRLPFKAKRLQKFLNEPLDQVELGRINAFVQYAHKKGVHVILDPHDYGYFADDTPKGQLIGTDAMPAKHFANFWARVAVSFKNQPNVMFNIINEPKDQKAHQWQSAAIASISAIRAVGANNKLLIPGTKWTGAHSWIKAGNGKTWAGFHDKNFAIEVHQYLDEWSAGTLQPCKVGVGATRLAAFTKWLRENNKKGFLGEFGWGDNAGCKVEATALLNHIKANSDVMIGWTYFGAAWYNGFMTVNPIDMGKPTQADRPQMKLLLNYLK